MFIITLLKYSVFVDGRYHFILGMSFMFILKNWDRSVSIAAVLRVGRSRARFLAVRVIFMFFRLSTLVLVPTQPPIQEVVTAVPTELMYENDNSLLSTAKVKNE
jgi:hypothetical protein